MGLYYLRSENKDADQLPVTAKSRFSQDVAQSFLTTQIKLFRQWIIKP